MSTFKTLRAIALATSCLVPMAAFAQSPAAQPAAATKPYSGDLQIGIGGVAGTNPDQFGRYNGLNTTGIDLFGSFHFNYRDPWDSGGTRSAAAASASPRAFRRPSSSVVNQDEASRGSTPNFSRRSK